MHEITKAYNVFHSKQMFCIQYIVIGYILETCAHIYMGGWMGLNVTFTQMSSGQVQTVVMRLGALVAPEECTSKMPEYK